MAPALHSLDVAFESAWHWRVRVIGLAAAGLLVAAYLTSYQSGMVA